MKTKMKKALILSASMVVLGLTSQTYAGWFSSEKADAHPAVATAANKPADQINLYEKADSKSKVLGHVTPQSNLVVIMRKGAWIKVGDRSNGHVGWINHKQFMRAREEMMQPDIQQVYVNVERDPKTGKMVYNVVAYKNGKKLSDAQAKKLYKRLRTQQHQEWRNTRRFQQRMQKIFDWDWQSMRRMQQQFDQDGANIRRYFGPGPVVPPADSHSGNKDQAASQQPGA